MKLVASDPEHEEVDRQVSPSGEPGSSSSGVGQPSDGGNPAPERSGKTDLESRVRRHLGCGQTGEALAIVLKAFGPGILGYLCKLLDEDDARDVYSDFEEHLLRGLPAFRWECTLRAWAYLVARNCYRHLLRDAYRRRRTRLRTSMASRLAASTSMTRMASQDRLLCMKSCLLPDEQTLLTLRLDREMSWEEIAVVLSEPRPVSPAALRQRFHRIKEKVARQVRQNW